LRLCGIAARLKLAARVARVSHRVARMRARW
jgi:hypothetical protein